MDYKRRLKYFLSKAEEYTGIDLNYFGSGAFWLLLAQITNFISALVLTIVLAKYMDAEAFGNYKFALYAIAVLSVFSLPGMNTAATRSISKGAVLNMDKLLFKKMQTALWGSAIAMGISMYFIYTSQPEYVNIFLIIAVLLPFYDSFYLYSSYLKGKLNFKILSLSNISSRIFQTLTVLFLLFFTNNFNIIFTGYATSFILAQLIFYCISRRNFKSQTLNDSTELKNDEDNSVVKYAYQLFTVNILGQVFENLDKILIWYFMGAKTLAIYVILLSIPLSIIRFITPLSELIVPKISRVKLTRELLKKYFQNIRRSLLFLFIIFILTANISIWLSPKLFPNYNINSIGLFVLASLFVVLIPINSWIHELLMSMKLSKNYSVVLISSIVLEILLFYLNYMLFNSISAILISIIIVRIIHIVLLKSIALRYIE